MLPWFMPDIARSPYFCISACIPIMSSIGSIDSWSVLCQPLQRRQRWHADQRIRQCAGCRIVSGWMRRTGCGLSNGTIAIPI
jgi:hypothetical protein